jgi:ABC-type bacteriocin/lantibiotic exporter with double-glycine peptidase domain
MFKIINEGMTDRVIRVILSVVFFLVGYLMFIGLWQIVFYVLGLISLVTGITGFCAIYKIFGWSANKKTE